MKELFVTFLQSPSAENYRQLFTAIEESEYYDPHSDPLEEVGQLHSEGKTEQAMEKLSAAFPNLLLSPTAHQIAGFLHHKLGNEDGANMEMMISRACLEGILASGDGTKDSPYQVLRVSDEYDLLQFLEKEMKSQSLTEVDGRHCDVMRCTDGSEYWFDISASMNKLREQFGD
ncbi:DUF4919 domain-containing protein [Bremerella sp.]|uniref:DUF4919 domain-containing protein n=1 Tax=Bremerella sp. TaxID=2795602 RepID=UPI00391C92DE